MDASWFDRDSIDERLCSIELRTLKYDPDTGQYCLDGEPFTGVTSSRHRDGKLQGLSHFKDGVENGVSVAWYPNGQIRLYSEMADDVYHGWHIEWNEDGTKRLEAHYTAGELDDANRSA